jgi:CheY-like chemotaxis protein
MEWSRDDTVVLVAEDDPNALSGYVEFLNTAGFVASGCASGGEALTSALDHLPDIVVTDIAMPGLDGFSLAAALRGEPRTKHVPILGLTAHWTPEIQNDAHKAGFSAMLLKPCLPAHLLAEIERVLRHSRLMAEAIGRGTVDATTPMPVGLRNAVLRRRAQQYF